MKLKLENGYLRSFGILLLNVFFMPCKVQPTEYTRKYIVVYRTRVQISRFLLQVQKSARFLRNIIVDVLGLYLPAGTIYVEQLYAGRAEC